MFAGLLGAAWALAGSVAAADTVVEPDWEARPRGEDMAEHYPKLATRLLIEGRATISCVVDVEGRLMGCRLVDEAPLDLGFGSAALALADTFKMKPKTVNGEPVAGGTVRIPIMFRLPPAEAEPALPEPASAADLDAALRLVDATKMVDRGFEEIERNLRFSDPGVPVAVRAAGVQALREAWNSDREGVRQAYAKAAASVFSEDEMKEIAKFAEVSPGGPGDSRLQAAPATIAMDYLARMREAALEAYCAKQSCPEPSELARVWRQGAGEQSHLGSPQWARAPSDFRVRRAAPKLPAAVGISAAVRMTCQVQGSGELERCRVADESPRGLGYGEAALGLADQYQLHPFQLADLAKGQKVDVRIGFTPLETSKRYQPPAGAKESALTHAREVAAAFWDGQQLSVEVALLGLQTSPPKTADEDLNEALAEAYREGAKAAQSATIENLARTIAAEYSEGELARMAEFYASPAGRAFRERAPAMGVALGRATAHVGETVVKVARAEFCRTFDCDPWKAQSAGASPEPSTRKP